MFGIDVSHHQNPATIPWDKIAHDSSFCIVRATYGAGLRDRHCAEHTRRARQVGMQVGLYHFFRPSQNVENQIIAFRKAAQAAGCAPGDIVPTIDVEADPIPHNQPVTTEWEPGVKRMADALTVEFGAPCMIYITQREFGMLGRPEWMLSHPLWVAHYTGAAKPATPNNAPWTIWQHRVGPYVANGAGGYDKKRPELDQNRANGPLPLAQRVPWGIVPPITLPPSEYQDNDDDWDELCAKAMAAQVDVTGALHADGMRELAGLETQPPPDDESNT